MFTLLAIPWVRKCAEALLLIGALTAIIYALYDKGVHAGRAQEAAAQVQGSKPEFQRVEIALQQQLAAQNATVEQYRQLVVTLIQKAGDAGHQAQAAAAAGTADKQKLSTIVDSQIQQDLEAKLGGPLSSPEILRLDDSIVTDYPHVKAQAGALIAQVTALSEAGDAKDEELTAVAGQRDVAIGAYNDLVPNYVRAYNVAVKPPRKWFCLFLCRGKALALPAPVTLPKVDTSTGYKALGRATPRAALRPAQPSLDDK